MDSAALSIQVLTAFPNMFPGPLGESICGRAIEDGRLHLRTTNLRDFAYDRHRSIDDTPFGGGGGMVLRAQPVLDGVASIRSEAEFEGAPIILLGAQGRRFDHACAVELSLMPQWIMVCGHYKGLDERIRSILNPVEISVGDYVLTGGELAAMVLIDSAVRLLPGALGNFDSAAGDSFYDGLLEGPIFTRPRSVEGQEVPQDLLSGDHERVRRWRLKEAMRTTLQFRPDLMQNRSFTAEEEELLAEIERERPGATETEGRDPKEC